MATVKLDEVKWGENSYPLNLQINASNIEALESACRAYREETKLPETLSDIRERLTKMCRTEGYFYSLGFEGQVSIDGFDRISMISDDDANCFPKQWQAEKLHALACMEQVWIALHDGDFEWFVGSDDPSFCCLAIGNLNGGNTEILELVRGYHCHMSPFPFRTRALAEKARRILTDEVIKTAFSVK